MLDTGTYPLGSDVELRIDPRDPSWSRLVAEPLDATYWLTGALAALLFAAVTAGLQVRARGAAEHLYATPSSALHVSGSVGDDIVEIRAAGDSRGPAVATLRIRESRGSGAVMEVPPWVALWARARPWLSYDRSAGAPWPRDEQQVHHRTGLVVVGMLRDRGWAAVMTEEGDLVSTGTLRVAGRPRRRAPRVRPL